MSSLVDFGTTGGTSSSSTFAISMNWGFKSFIESEERKDTKTALANSDWNSLSIPPES